MKIKDSINPKELEKLPLSSLIALAVASFVGVVTETMPSGLLLEIGRNLSISESLAGQLVTFYALGSLVAAIPVMTATRSWNRRKLLLTCISGFFIFNTITAVSSWFLLTIIARFFVGVSAGVLWGLSAGYARRMVVERLKGKAIAIAMMGTPIGLALGVPAGTLLGTLVGWRFVFILMSLIAFILIFWIMKQLPDFSGEKGTKKSLKQVLLLPGIRSNLFIVLTWVLAHNILYIYISPYLASNNFQNMIGFVLLIFGVASVIGIWIVGVLIQRWLRMLITVSLVGFSVAAIFIGIGSQSLLFVFIGVAIWGLTMGGAATLLQTDLSELAGNSTDIAQAMLVTVWNIAISGGGIVGGIVIESLSVNSLPWSTLIVIAIGIATVIIRNSSKVAVNTNQI
ncbi:MFS transporter [Clostridium estertheticum]|uniref:MFS transporter n=1 Tax=Clostridium estertheticum TaxID=238834 RepID=UPI001C0AD887|nr:MFS transporter [Clostridium estertheticum]MBU3202358.1 MFS transporter [Clostridium estertheticum]WAG66524.1 MFS transporter [Clostridium estertheticum]